MSKDEPVDGAKIAAQIISRMKPAQRERIMQAINAQAPEVAEKIQDKTINFDFIAELTEKGAQVLIQEVDHKDLVVALKTASAKVKDMLFKSMSERKRGMVEGDYADLPPMKLSDIDEAQRRILNKLEELQAAGRIRSQSMDDVWV